MNTAKELACKAYCDALKLAVIKVTGKLDEPVLPFLNMNEAELNERFENWWSQNVWDNEHRDSFQPELSVFIEGKRYIQAE